MQLSSYSEELSHKQVKNHGQSTEACSTKSEDFCLGQSVSLSIQLGQVGCGTANQQVGSRKPIKKFTQTSRDRLRFKIRNALCVWTCLTTLTYPAKYPRDGREVKKHLNTLLTNIRRDYPGIRYIWWLEFQERGAPHIHLITTCPLPGYMYINPLWYNIVGSEDRCHETSGVDVKNFYGDLEGYKIAEIYASKMVQKAKPPGYSRVGRYWGCSRNLIAPTTTISGLSSVLAAEVNAKVDESTSKDRDRVRTENVWLEGRSSELQSTGFLWEGAKASAAVCHETRFTERRPRCLMKGFSFKCTGT